MILNATVFKYEWSTIKLSFMKKYSFVCTTFTMLVFALLFTGCLKDTCKYQHSYTFYEPVYRTSAEVRANIKSNPPAEIKAPGKIVILGNYIFLNEINKGIHVLDNSNPSSPKNIAFIDIPGNLDLAVKGTSLYADLYTDLVTLDISNPLNVVKTNITDGVFPVRYYEGAVFGDSGKILYAWIKRDTTIIEDCDHPGLVTVPGAYFAQDFSAGGYIKSNSAPIGTGGSMARFALINNYLYTVGDMDLNAFNITNSKQPVFADKLQVDFHLETLYPFGNKLFIGANNGMFIYNVSSSPGHPVKVGEF